MQLINLDHSPYAARIRIQIRKKKLPINIVPPPITLKTDDFLAAFPLGKIPLLQLDDNEFLPESVAIMEYLEDQYPEQPFRPQDKIARARMRVLSSFTDTHLGPALVPFFKSVLLPDFTFDHEEQHTTVLVTLSKLNYWMSKDESPMNRKMHLGDMILAPSLWYVTALLSLFGYKNQLDKLIHLQKWWDWMIDDTQVTITIDEVEAAFRDFVEAQ